MPYIHEGPSLYRTADDVVVEEGDARAAFLLVADGGTLDDETAAKYGLKAKHPAANKAKAAPENKAGLTIEHDNAPRTVKLGKTK